MSALQEAPQQMQDLKLAAAHLAPGIEVDDLHRSYCVSPAALPPVGLYLIQHMGSLICSMSREPGTGTVSVFVSRASSKRDGTRTSR